MDDLVQWLGEQLDEDERTAQATVWDNSGNKLSWELIASATIDVGGDEFYVGDRTIANHMMAWEPARVLRETDAKRQILRAFERADVALRNTEPGKEPRELMTGAANSLRAAVRMLATVYADRSGYREEWRP